MIHYHGTPLSGTKLDAFTFLEGRHALVSFARQDQLDVVIEVCSSFVLDNGAFTAWRRGAAYDFVGYREWAAKWIEHPACDWCVIPDVIDGHENDNDALIRSWTLPNALSVPVWHLHESLGRLAWLAAGFPRIAFGSSGQYKDPNEPEWWDRISEAMDTLTSRGGLRTRLHGLRMLNPAIVKHIPFSSCDSSRVARGIVKDSEWVGRTRNNGLRAKLIAEPIERQQAARKWIGPPKRSQALGLLFT